MRVLTIVFQIFVMSVAKSGREKFEVKITGEKFNIFRRLKNSANFGGLKNALKLLEKRFAKFCEFHPKLEAT